MSVGNDAKRRPTPTPRAGRTCISDPHCAQAQCTQPRLESRHDAGAHPQVLRKSNTRVCTTRTVRTTSGSSADLRSLELQGGQLRAGNKAHKVNGKNQDSQKSESGRNMLRSPKLELAQLGVDRGCGGILHPSRSGYGSVRVGGGACEDRSVCGDGRAGVRGAGVDIKLWMDVHCISVSCPTGAAPQHVPDCENGEAPYPILSSRVGPFQTQSRDNTT